MQPASPTATGQEAHWQIADELFERLRGANYLVFPAGVGLVEFFADALRQRCEAAGLPVTYFPHHERLAKSEREETESELKRGSLPVSAICTTTLEMGIDIGAIKGVVQIGAAPTVSSLCQRIGQAGRRAGDSAVLWQYCVAQTPAPGAGCVDSLHQDVLQAVAVIQLFLAKWVEPPQVGALHYSTLIQQVLSLVGERHGLTTAQAYQVLCASGPFKNITEACFTALLRAMLAHDLLMQDGNRLLLHGRQGEWRVNHYTFFAAFPETQEYHLRQAGKALGTLPLPSHSAPDDVITFAGRRWRIEAIDHDKRRVDLIPSVTGQLPTTGGSGLPVHVRVRQQMHTLLASSVLPAWLDRTATSLLNDARRQYVALHLNRESFVVEGLTVYWFLWQGDALQDALALLLKSQGLAASNFGICLAVARSSVAQVAQCLHHIGQQPCPAPHQVLTRQDINNVEKWDWVLPDDLFLLTYASRVLALQEAHALCQSWPPDL